MDAQTFLLQVSVLRPSLEERCAEQSQSVSRGPSIARPPQPREQPLPRHCLGANPSVQSGLWGRSP